MCDQALSQEASMSDIFVRHEHGDRFTISVRGHDITIDQPLEDGGGDEGPSPSELFVASLAGCVGFFAERFLVRHGISTEGLGVQATYEYSEDAPSRVASIDVQLVIPAGFPESRMPALMRVVDRCTVHNSLRQAPQVRISTKLPSSV
jgi:putative redox protein